MQLDGGVAGKSSEPNRADGVLHATNGLRPTVRPHFSRWFGISSSFMRDWKGVLSLVWRSAFRLRRTHKKPRAQRQIAWIFPFLQAPRTVPLVLRTGLHISPESGVRFLWREWLLKFF